MNMAGRMAKYLAISLAMENVKSAPRVISNCLPMATTSISLVGLLSRSTMLPASLAAMVPVFIARPTSACASAGASLVPSPVIATRRPPACSFLIRSILSLGVACARKSSVPASAAMAAAVSGLSPVIMTVRIPMARSCWKRSRIPPLTTSFKCTTPSARLPSATTSGVPPEREMRSVTSISSVGTSPPCSRTNSITESVAPLRMRRPSRSTPLMRVCAVNGMKRASCSATSRPRMLYFCLARTTMERPSGVSSARLESCAASASSSSLTPPMGMNSTACRLPSVMVPVLSSSSVLTSPAASTALPLMASTLCCITRSSDLMPMAESSPPMVVGIRHTSRETSIVTVGALPLPLAATLYRAKGCSVTTASRNTKVSPEITMFKAISLGVFCRSAPSTRAIMRSRNVSPGLEVILILTQSESTLVPPVTALRSPPDSRITGALSPVMADSSTLAMPSTTSPSPGMVSPAFTRTRSPLRSAVAGTASSVPLRSRRAVVSVLVLRNVSAWALPRPSAMASAKLANSTVNHSHKAIWKVNPAKPAPLAISRTVKMVVMTAPTSTTNITGFFIMARGFSLTNESLTARLTIGGSNSGRARDPLLGMIDVTSSDGLDGVGATVAIISLAPKLALNHQEMFHDRTERKRGEVRQRAHNQHDADQQGHEQRPVRGKRSGRDRHEFLLGQAARRRQQGNQHQEPPGEHGQPDGRIEERSIGVDAGERAAVVARAAAVGVNDFREPVRPVVVQVASGGAGRIDPAIFGEVRHRAVRGESQDRERQHQDRQHHHLDFLLLDLLAQILRRAAHHQAGCQWWGRAD